MGAGARPRDASMDDAVVRMAEIVGLEPRERTQGVVDAMCPNWHAHGDRPETGFSFIGSDGACFCNHASCDTLTTPDFVAMVRTQYEDHVSGLIAMGLNTENLPESSSIFEAGVGFGVDNATEQRILQAEVEAMASRNERRREQAAEAHEDGVARLVKRFIWVKGAEAYYDTLERTFYSPSGIARHEAVTGVIPAGSTGQKAASNVLANRADRVVAAGLAYVPGATEALVDLESDNGITAPHINTWVPSRYRAIKGSPGLWLRAAKHVLHNDGYRNWILDWLAWIIQNPAGRTPIIPLLISGQGVGKDTVLRPIQQILGTHNCTGVTTGQLTGNFTEFLRKRLLILQEAKFDAGGAAYNRVKDWSGNATGWVEVNEKYQRPYRLRFAGVFIALSNDEGAVRGIDHDDRRFAPFVSEAGRLDAVFSPADHAAMDSADEIGRVRWFLEARDLSNFNPYTAPQDTSGSRTRIIAAGMSAASRVAYELVSNGPFSERELIAFHEVMTAVQNGPSRAAANSATWGNVQAGLAAAGCIRIRPKGADQVKVNGSNTRLWTGPKARASLLDMQTQAVTPPKTYAEAYQADLEKSKQMHEAELFGGAQ